MKSCPTCHQSYEDETMLFCLADGTKLQPATIAQIPLPTMVLPRPGATDPGPTVASPQPPVQPTMLAPPELVRVNPQSYPSAPPYGPTERSRASALPWLLGIALVLGLSGIIIALIVTRSSGPTSQPIVQASSPAPSPARSNELIGESSPSPTTEPSAAPKATATPTVAATPAKSPERPPNTDKLVPGPVVVTRPLPKETPTPERPKPMFSVLNNMTFNGSRITYYPRPSFGMCQADCASNANCKGFTWIRPGAYNPGDSAMCYLMSAVTARVPHDCCISAVRN